MHTKKLVKEMRNLNKLLYCSKILKSRWTWKLDWSKRKKPRWSWSLTTFGHAQQRKISKNCSTTWTNIRLNWTQFYFVWLILKKEDQSCKNNLTWKCPALWFKQESNEWKSNQIRMKKSLSRISTKHFKIETKLIETPMIWHQ